MKQLITIILILCLSHSFAAPPVKKSTNRYEPFQEQTVILPTPFAKPFIIDKSDIDLLAGKTIHHVDLIYTAYKSSPGFDQERLNEQRISELKKLLPQINADNPTWASIEQTGAKDRETANTYFHGFVIHYTDKQDPNELRTFFSDKAKSMTDYTVSSEKGGTFDYPSGTKITIPANAVTYADGSPVKGNYELHYREFRNPAEIALSGIPMTYNQKGTEYNFSSVGMYEVRGTQNGRDLQLKKPVKVDFNCTKVVDDAAFYQLDDKNGEWKKIEPIVFNQVQAKPVEVVANGPASQTGSHWSSEGSKNAQIETNVAPVDSQRGLYMDYETKDDETTVRMNPNAWKRFQKSSKNSPDLMKAITFTDEASRTLHIKSKNYDQLTVLVFGQVFLKLAPVDMNAGAYATLLAAGIDANHTYPALVRGLNSPEFGVYNADQIYRIGSPANLSPVYVDAKTGQPIENQHVACVIDLNYNGSFSFQPNNLICNAQGRNIILLFTKDKKVYMLDEKAFAAADKSQLKVNFEMTDVSETLKTPDDLKHLLKL